MKRRNKGVAGQATRVVALSFGGVILVGALLLLIHLAGLSSLGEAYLAPFSDVKMGSAVVRHRYGGKGGK